MIAGEALVTGASGFLGGHLANRLAAEGQSVRALVRQASDVSRLVDREGIRIVYGDLDDPEGLRECVEGVSEIYHCAARSSDWGKGEAFRSANVSGVENLVELAMGNEGFRRFLHVSTTDVYGYPRIPGDESLGVERVGLRYNESKIEGEEVLWRAFNKFGFPVTILRPATIYGPYSKSIVKEIYDHLKWRGMLLVDGGESSAGLVYVDNLVDAAVSASKVPNTVGKAYNITDDETVSWKRFVGELAGGMGVKPPFLNVSENFALRLGGFFEGVWRRLNISSRPPLTRHAAYLLCRDQQYDNRLAEQDFGFASRVSFEEGMRRTVKWLKSEGV